MGGHFSSRREQSGFLAKIKTRHGSVYALLVAAILLDACKQPQRPSESALNVSDTDTSPTAEILVAAQNTTLKKYLLQSSVLGSTDVCPIPEGTKITVESLRHEGVGHWRLFNLTEVQLPNGETAQVPRHSNEGSVTAASGDAGAVSSPTTGADPSSEMDGVESVSSDEVTKKASTPAELLNCSLLEGSSFLVFSAHFKRESLDEKGSRDEQKPDPENNLGSSTWMWPTRGRKIRSDAAGNGHFNAPRASGRGHQGIDIVAAVGEPVLATRSGVIIDPNWEGSYGRVLDIKHASGVSSRYAHLSSFTYSHGTYVKQGDRVGAAGRTGNASGYGVTPHLHFEIRYGTRLQNPLSLLP